MLYNKIIPFLNDITTQNVLFKLKHLDLKSH